jgi:beta-galactosidase
MRLLIYFVILVALLGTAHLLVADSALPQAGSGEPPGTTVICPLKDNKAAAVSITMDDALLASDRFFNDLFKKYNLKGTLALIADRMDQAGSWGEFRALLKDGRLDVGNHSMTHEKLTNVKDKKLESEVNGARQRFRKAFPGQDVICMLYPDNASNDLVRAKVKEQHYAARGGIRGDNSLDPTEDEWFNLKTRGLKDRDYGQGTGFDGVVLVSDMNAWIDTAIDNNRWVIEMLHGVKEKDPHSYAPPAGADVAEHFSYLSGKLDKVWCGTFTEVTKYIRQRQNAAITQLLTDGSYFSISLKDTLDNSIFNFPLTLKTRVPNEWNSVRVEQNDKIQMVTPVEEYGAKYIYYDAIPDQGNITISLS